MRVQHNFHYGTVLQRCPPHLQIQWQHTKKKLFSNSSSDVQGSTWVFSFLSVGTDCVYMLWCLITNSYPQHTTSAGRDLQQPPSSTSWPAQGWPKLNHVVEGILQMPLKHLAASGHCGWYLMNLEGSFDEKIFAYLSISLNFAWIMVKTSLNKKVHTCLD